MHVAVELIDAVERECERVFRDDFRSSGGGRGVENCVLLDSASGRLNGRNWDDSSIVVFNKVTSAKIDSNRAFPQKKNYVAA